MDSFKSKTSFSMTSILLRISVVLFVDRCNYSGCQVHGSRFTVDNFALLIFFEIVDKSTNGSTCSSGLFLNIFALADMHSSEVIRFKVHGWLPYLHTGLCSSFSNLEPWNCEPEKFLVSVSSVSSHLQILASLLNGTLSESIHAPVARPQYLQTVQSSSLSNPWPRPGLAVLFIESQGAVFRRTVLKHTLRRTRAGLNREPLNFEPE
jgi:hypothetical protein